MIGLGGARTDRDYHYSLLLRVLVLITLHLPPVFSKWASLALVPISIYYYDVGRICSDKEKAKVSSRELDWNRFSGPEIDWHKANIIRLKYGHSNNNVMHESHVTQDNQYKCRIRGQIHKYHYSDGLGNTLLTANCPNPWGCFIYRLDGKCYGWYWH